MTYNALRASNGSKRLASIDLEINYNNLKFQIKKYFKITNFYYLQQNHFQNET